MQTQTLSQRAAEYARVIHRDQVRKYTGEPYFRHLESVARIVRGKGYSEDAVAAAFLHDSIEDQGESRERLEALFNPVVARLVWEVSDQSKKEDGNRAARKAIDREHLSKASPEGKAIKLADLIDNTMDIALHDPSFARVYLREKRLLLPLLFDASNAALWYQASAIAIASEALMDRTDGAEDTIRAVYKKFGADASDPVTFAPGVSVEEVVKFILGGCHA